MGPAGGSAVVVAVLLAAAVLLLPVRHHADDAPGTAAEEPSRRRWAAGGGQVRLRQGVSAVDGPARADQVHVGGGPEVSAALALLALAYRSGLPTWQVLLAVASGTHGPVARDLRQVATALRWGADESEAWGGVGPAWSPAARAVAIAHRAGVPPGPMLQAASDDLRAADLERLEIAAAKVGVRLVAPLGLVLLPAFCLTTVVPLVVAPANRLLDS
jgi:hypothetical protein